MGENREGPEQALGPGREAPVELEVLRGSVRRPRHPGARAPHVVEAGPLLEGLGQLRTMSNMH